jgi:hypothetical protein
LTWRFHAKTFVIFKEGDLHMDINSLCERMQQRCTPMGGHARVLDADAIVISWKQVQGLIIVSADGGAFLKVSTSWKDSDTAVTEREEDIPDRMVALFQEFCDRRRGEVE